jgi:hypothetical protein
MREEKRGGGREGDKEVGRRGESCRRMKRR